MAKASVEFEVVGDSLTAITEQLLKLDQTVTIGVHDDATPYPDGTDVVMVAAAQEFGTHGEDGEGIPSRPFVRGYFDSKGARELGDAAAPVVANIIDGRATALAVGDAIGSVGVQGVRAYIEAGIDPELSRETRDKKGRDSRMIPLLDSGHLVSQVKRKVEPA